ncbi:hypothetical protein [Paenibacillus glacialis]|uniref:hypothetical protein n=1 Tax=Paenibacillus glacialis TaxID=494026 RepID=UPI001373160C|nr:hypothetical protein [Paenibacillus glacialis]
MKTKYDFWLIKNNKAANAYMDEVARESNEEDRGQPRYRRASDEVEERDADTSDEES